MDIKIEKLKLKDLPCILEFYKKLLPIKQDYKISKGIYKRIMFNNNYIILVAKKDNIVVGTLTGVICKSIAWGGYDFMVLDYLYVDDHYRNLGIATKLFKAIEEYATKRLCGYIFFTSSIKNKNAHKLYEKLGYTKDVIGFRKVLINYV